jgi:hypothetical protein
MISRMKKLALTIATLGLLAAPVFACPNMEEKTEAKEETAPRTAEKAKPADKAKEQPKTEAKPADKAKEQPKTEAKKQPDKKAEKVSQR